MADTYYTVADIRIANRDAGHYFFSPGAMRQFSSRILPTVYAGHFFVTSEAEGIYNAPVRRFTVRCVDHRGHVDTVEVPNDDTSERNGFRAYGSAQAARTVAKRLAWLRFDRGDGQAVTLPMSLQATQMQWDHTPYLVALASEAYNAGRTFAREPGDDAGNVDGAAHKWYDRVHGDRREQSVNHVYGLVKCFKMGAVGATEEE